MSAEQKPHSGFTRLDAIKAAWIDAEVEDVFSTAQMDMAYLFEQFDALRTAVQKELDYMDGFPDVEDGSPLALVIESLRLALSNPARTLTSILDGSERELNPARGHSMRYGTGANPPSYPAKRPT